jgi:flagellar motility protein MotE (MotC chaperone)
MRRNPRCHVPAMIIVMLSFGATLAAGAGSPSPSTSASKTETAEEAVRDREPLEDQADPVRPQGPALDVPQEIIEMLSQRQRAISRREELIRTEEARLLSLKQDIEAILARRQEIAKAPQTGPKEKQKPADVDAAAKASVEQVVKMYETMPPEEAAVRVEKLPIDMALQVLRSLKGKTAGAILASVKPDKAAKLTERFLTPATIKTTPIGR